MLSGRSWFFNLSGPSKGARKAFITKEAIEIMKKPPQIVERLVLVCIDSYDSEKRRILQHFAKSTRFAFFCAAPLSKFADFFMFKIADFRRF